jgi:hypothetical protein
MLRRLECTPARAKGGACRGPLKAPVSSVMKCDLCKRDAISTGNLLCGTCADAIRRLIVISRKPAEDEKPMAVRANAA